MVHNRNNAHRFERGRSLRDFKMRRQGKPTTTGWNPVRISRAWDILMKRLGYTRCVSQGGDWGAKASGALARQAPEGLLGIHMNLLSKT
jgi:pimeloyl-ACP methyl ester carboxylesterase